MEHRLNWNSIDLFEAYLIKEEKAEATIKKYIRDVRSFFSFLGETGRNFHNEGFIVTKETVIDYKETLIKRFKPASVNSMLVALNSFLRFSRCGLCCTFA